MVRNTFIISLLLLVTGIFAQNTIVEQFTEALKSGAADDFATLLDEEVMIQIDEDEDYLSRADALDKLTQFIAENPAKQVEIKHSGKSKDGTYFSIGTYSGMNSNVMRLYFVVKEDKVSEFCIEYE